MANTAILSLLAFGSRTPSPPAAPVVEVILMPPPAAARAPPPERPSPTPGPRAGRQLAVSAQPAPPLVGAASGPEPDATRPHAYTSFFRDFVPGCEREILALLSPAERERCNARIAAATRAGRRGFADEPALDLGRTIRIAPDRMAGFEASAETQRVRRQTPGRAPIVPCGGRSANFGVGCLPE